MNTYTECYNCKKNIADDEFGCVEYLGDENYSTICSTCYMKWINEGYERPIIKNIEQIEPKTRDNFMYSWHFDAIEAENSIFNKLRDGEITIDDAIKDFELVIEILKKIAQSKGDSEKSDTKLMFKKMAMRLNGLKQQRNSKITVSQ